jgi:hypothetical protein
VSASTYDIAWSIVVVADLALTIAALILRAWRDSR